MAISKVGTTKNADKVSDTHRCVFCDKGKDEVDFRVTCGFGTFTPEKYCTTCRPTRSKGLPKSDLTVSVRIKLYFEEIYGEKD